MQDRHKIFSYIAKIFEYIGKPVYIILVAVVILFSLIVSILNNLFTQLNRIAKPSFRFLKTPLPTLSLVIPRQVIIITALIVMVGSGVTGIYFNILKDLPHPQQLTSRHQPITTNIYDRHGRLLYQVFQDENRTLVNLEDIPTHVILATLAIEDSSFYHHPGFSWRGIIRATKLNLQGQPLQGGSTITQQLVKNVLLTPERTITRKIRELLLAVAVESYYTKDEILNMYFNEVSYGGTAYGIEAASQQYFDKPVTSLSLAEASLLAGLPAAPTLYSPFGANPNRALNRQRQVINRMVLEGYITQEQARRAINTPLTFTNPATNIHAPHFVMYTREWLVNHFSETQVSQGGLKVVTSLDLELQQYIESVVQHELDANKHLNISNAAVLVTRPHTGEILAMVGSRDYFDSINDGQVNVTTRPRQPGSSIKPITYVAALENDFTPLSIIYDTPVTYHIPGSRPYSPRNYDYTFRGPVTLRQALASSYNVPAVKILEQIGVSRLVNKAREMGITTWEDSSRFGLSLTLGSGEVKMIDMATAYGVLANYGYRVQTNPIISVTSFDHQLLDSNPCLNQTSACRRQTSVTPQVAYQLNHILSDNQARTPAFGAFSKLKIPGHQVAVKTGTTNSLRDNWAFAYTTDYVVSVWVGNNDNTPMSRVASGISGSSPIMNRVMTALLDDKPPHAFIPPSDIIAVQTCPLTGTLSCAACPQPITEYFIPGTEPQYSCSNEYVNQLLTLDTSTPLETQ